MGEVLELANCHVNMKFALVVIYPHDFRKKEQLCFFFSIICSIAREKKLAGQLKPNRISSMALTKALFNQVSLYLKRRWL